MVVSGWENAMTYAVGCSLSAGEVAFCGGDPSRDRTLDEMSTVAGCKSHTISILSSADNKRVRRLGGMFGIIPDTVAT